MFGYEPLQRLWYRLQSSQRFRRVTAAMPILQWIARRRARQLYDLCAGFVYSQILLACVRLDLFERLYARTMTAAELATETGLTPAAMERLLRGGRALNLFKRASGGRYALAKLGIAMIGNGGVREMIEHHPMLYQDLADPVALLRGQVKTEINRYWAYAGNAAPAEVSAESVAPYTDLMSVSQPMVTTEILTAYSLKRHRCLLDIAGGDGRFVTAVAERHPHLKVMVFDLPAVAEQARTRFRQAGIEGRAEAFGGDVYRDALPTGADLVTLVRVIHDHDDEGAERIIAAAYQALAPGGTLLIAEVMSDTPGGKPMGDAYFGFYLLAMGSGRSRSPQEIKAMLTAAGFSRVRLHANPMPLLARVMTARKL